MGGKFSAPRRAVVLLVFVAALAATGVATGMTGPIGSAPAAEDTTARFEGGNLWFVEFAGAPLTKGGNPAKLKAERDAFAAAAADAGVAYTPRYSFDTLWNGLSVKVDPSNLSTLSRLPGVKALYPVNVVQAPREESLSPDLQTAIAMTGADKAQSELGYDGTGIKVAVMDTGIDYDHPDLGGDGVARSNSTHFPNARVTTGWDFVGDSYNATESSPNYQPVPHPDQYPDDCYGHGTHVAGIVGANGNFSTGGARGVAPGVTFGSYRVFGCDGSTTDDVMIAAMERALADHMNVLNMSIGDAFDTWPDAPTAKASDALVDQGMVVVASIGNSGADGVYSAGAPGVGAKVIGVASYDNTHIRLKTFTVTPGGESVGYQTMTGAANPPTTGSLELARTGTTTSSADACSALPGGSLAGKAALIRRGGCTFRIKAVNAVNAGAVAVLIYNNSAGNFAGTIVGTDPAGDLSTVPVISISNTDGALLDSKLASGATTLTWTNQEGTFPNPTGGLISSYSSYGLGADLSLKPDIGAPGGLIRSTWPLEQGAYATISGTSMASPHVAGAVALLLQAKGWTNATPAQAASVRGLLQNTAVPKLWSLNPGTGVLDAVHRQGAGMLQIDKAIQSKVSVIPAKIALGEAGADDHEVLTLANTGTTAVTYDLSSADGIATYGSTFSPSYATEGAVAFDSSSVSVPAGGTATVGVTLARPDDDPFRVVYGGYITLTPQGGGQVLRVPYAGYAGDYQAIPVMTSGGNSFPRLAKRLGWVSTSDYTPTYSFPAATDSVVYTMTKPMIDGRKVEDVPTVAVHLNHQARWLKVTVLDPDGNPVVSQTASQTLDPVALVATDMPRNQTAGGYFTVSWDGRLQSTLSNGKVKSTNMPDGQYRLRIQVLKPLGTDPADVQTYTSPVFTIARG